MPGLSGLYSALVSTCSGTRASPTLATWSQWCSTPSASCSSATRPPAPTSPLKPGKLDTVKTRSPTVTWSFS